MFCSAGARNKRTGEKDIRRGKTAACHNRAACPHRKESARFSPLFLFCIFQFQVSLHFLPMQGRRPLSARVKQGAGSMCQAFGQ